MKNKVLIKLIIPTIDDSFDVFIPVNELIWKVKVLMLKAAFSLEEEKKKNELSYILMNRDSGRIYHNNEIIINTDIRNGSELLALPNKE